MQTTTPRINQSVVAQYVIGTIVSLVILWGALTGRFLLTVVEACGVVTGLISVWLTAKASVWNWPISLANSTFYIFVFLDAMLYANMSLQFVFIALCIWGWYQWLLGSRGGERGITFAPRAEWIALGIGIVVAFVMIFGLLKTLGGSNPEGDATVTALSLGALYLQGLKRVESWYLWIATDVFAIALYFVSGLPFTALLYTVYMALCVVGLIEWRGKALRQQPTS